MPSHAAAEVLSVADVGDGRAVVRFRLECGCEREDVVADDRLIERPEGGVLLVGKYPCPVGHAVQKR